MYERIKLLMNINEQKGKRNHNRKADWSNKHYLLKALPINLFLLGGSSELLSLKEFPSLSGAFLFKFLLELKYRIEKKRE